METELQQPVLTGCGEDGLRAIKDTMELLSGKWKIQLIGCLMMHGSMRFMDLRRRMSGIAAKMLSRELQELEQNRLIRRQVMDTRPVTVMYSLTEHGASLLQVIIEIRSWGMAHRKYLFHKT